ncbi:transcription factor TGA9-like isoform X1 [Ipomoea triloba]|uniref:transcription factor TGA9-like isoform X1 n=1 Tax=Ipomoea triloba TaxID=35885 RepID=UPI00125E7E61|nr:transcription factor TGA9-like isoform X1 [Ipomoea triloba]
MAASQRVGETGVTGTSSQHHHNMPYELLRGLNNPTTTPSFMYHSTPNSKEGPAAFDFGELEEAIVLQGVKINNNDEAKASLYAAATLEMFPSWPTRSSLHTPIPRGSSRSGEEESGDSGSGVNTFSSRAEGPDSPISTRPSSHLSQPSTQNHQLEIIMASDDSPRTTTGVSQTDHLEAAASKQPTHDKRRGAAGSTSDRVLDAKTLRRLAQNREAARKSRLRKKAYVQQLETSRIRLSQLEQELHSARSQGLFLGGGAAVGAGTSSGGAIFDMEYARWLDDDHRHISELRTALQAHLSDGELRVVVDGYIGHYDEIFRLKGEAAKSDVFHLITGMWTTPAERCFLWMGGFRPSELIKMLTGKLDPLTEQQVVGIYGLQHSSQQAEEALTQGLDQLQQSLVETIAVGSAAGDGGVHHMAMAIGKLANLEGFVRQADNLRQQTLHQLHRILTVRQAARCFLMIGEYYNRLRALSSLWASRPRETMIGGDDSSCQTTTTHLQMVQFSHQNHFSNF